MKRARYVQGDKVRPTHRGLSEGDPMSIVLDVKDPQWLGKKSFSGITKLTDDGWKLEYSKDKKKAYIPIDREPTFDEIREIYSYEFKHYNRY